MSETDPSREYLSHFLLNLVSRAQRRRDNQSLVQALQLQAQMLEGISISAPPYSRTATPIPAEYEEKPASKTSQALVSRKLQTERKGKRYQVQLSSRFLNTVFTFAAVRSYTGWQAQFWTYNRVPGDSEIFSLCAAGDIAGVRKLITEGKASPLDQSTDSRGQSTDTIQAAAKHIGNHPESTIELLTYLCQLTTLPDPSRTLLQLMWYMTNRHDKPPDWDRRLATSYFARTLSACHLDLSDLPDNPPGNPFDINEEEWIPHEMDLNVYQQWSVRPPSVLDFVHRRQRFWDIFFLELSANSFLEACGVEHVNADFARQHTNGRSALHFAAKALGATHPKLNRMDSRRGFGDHAEWFALCQVLLENGADYHLGFERNESPLDWYVQPCHTLPEKIYLVETWTELLIAAGVDVQNFWLVECIGHSMGRATWEILVSVDPGDTPMHDEQHIPAITVRVQGLIEEVVYCLKEQYVPGSWSDNAHSLPRTICWYPNKQELDEGSWEKFSGLPIDMQLEPVSAPTFLDKLEDQIYDRYRVALEGTQDDASPMVLLLNREARARSRRSASQPPPWSRNSATYVGVYSVDDHQWFPRVHFCPAECRRTLCPGSGWDAILEVTTVEVRSCYSLAPTESMYTDVRKGMPFRCGQCYRFFEYRGHHQHCTTHEKWAFS